MLGTGTFGNATMGLQQPTQETTASRDRGSRRKDLHTRKEIMALKHLAKEVMITNKTKKKYEGLAADAPVPTPKMSAAPWHFWEWWAGSAHLTAQMSKMRIDGKILNCGPPISWEFGWDIRNNDHRHRMDQLYYEFCPKILWFAITCGPWSNSNTNMDPVELAKIRKVEQKGMDYMIEKCEKQASRLADYVLEQPQASELLKQPGPMSILNLTNAVPDQAGCHCRHGLKDPENGMLNKKPFVLRGSVMFGRSCVWCTGDHTHQILQGTLRSGQARTDYAKTYTKQFCHSAAKDMLSHLLRAPYNNDVKRVEGRANTTTQAFPAGNDDGNDSTSSSDDGSVPAVPEESKDFVAPDAQPAHADDDDPPPEASAAEPKRRGKGKKTLEKDDDTLDDETSNALQDVVKRFGARLSVGAQRVFYNGSILLNTISALFPQVPWMVAIITRQHKSVPMCDPHVDTSKVTARKLLVKVSDDTNWVGGKIDNVWDNDTKFSRAPLWTVVLYGRERDELLDGILAPSEAARLKLGHSSEDDGLDLTLSGVLRIFNGSDTAKKNKVILELHRRSFHKPADEMRTMLKRAGLPARALAMVGEALKGCEVCEKWKQGSATPLVKTTLAGVFNQLVYADVVFLTIEDWKFMLFVDDCTRYVTVVTIDFKEFDDLERAFRRSWMCRFGPCTALRIDRESALASDKFGSYLEKIGTKRDLVRAKDDHSRMGILDRRVQLFRNFSQKLMEQMSSDGIVLEPEDLAAECEYCMNTQLSYAGVTPYSCLYGVLPPNILDVELDTLASFQEDCLPFYQHQLIRCRSLQSFHQALLTQRLDKTIHGQSRPNADFKYKKGDWIDVKTKVENKDLCPWRGPALCLDSDTRPGFITARWQGEVKDYPTKNVRPHRGLFNGTSLSLLKDDSEPLSSMIPGDDADVLPEGVGFVTSEQTVLYGDVRFAESVFATEAADSFKTPRRALAMLMDVADNLSHGGSLFHHAQINYTSQDMSFSRDAVQDNRYLFQLGQEAAVRMGIDNYTGIQLSAGRRFLQPVKGTLWVHLLVWQDGAPGEYQRRKLKGSWVVDIDKLTSNRSSKSRALAFFEGDKENDIGTRLQNMLESGEIPPCEDYPLGKTYHDLAESISTRLQQEEDDTQSSVSTRPSTGYETPLTGPSTSRTPSMQSLPSVVGDTLLLPSGDDSSMMTPYSPTNSSRTSVSEHEPFPEPTRRQWYERRRVDSITIPTYQHCIDVQNHDCFRVAVSSDVTNDTDDVVLLELEIGFDEVFSVEKELKPLTVDELNANYKDVKSSKLKELKSWLEHKTGHVQTTRKYCSETGLKPIPSRWVIEWKVKEGKKVIKCRLVAKGFAETNQFSLHTYSPTATKVGHRMVILKGAEKGWEIWSLDVSTAFLKGFTFDELLNTEIGGNKFKRQPCALRLPADVWQLFHELDPKNPYYQRAAESPELYSLVLDKCVYGLKDAPLLWSLKAVFILINELGLLRSKHDVCVFYLLDDSGILVLIISLHVDDTLATGTEKALTWLHKELQVRLGAMKAEKNSFRHYGVDILRNEKTFNITLDQTHYISQNLQPITRNKQRGVTVDSPATDAQISDYRSLVSGIAWVGVTSPGAQAVASLLQGFLPKPLVKHLDYANNALQQLAAEYVPHTFVHGFNIGKCKIVQTSDSSLGNTNKKKSQGGFLVFLAEDKDTELCGWFSLVMFRSGQSKRVANSTMCAEALAQLLGIESCLFLQTFLYELEHPSISALHLTKLEASDLLPIISCTDCNDVYEALISASPPNLTNLAITLHVTTLRYEKEIGKIRGWVWLDTDDMLANGLTKLNSDGTVPISDLNLALKQCWWRPNKQYRYNGLRVQMSA